MYFVLYRFIYDKMSSSSPSSMGYHHKVTSSYDSGIGSGQSSYHPDGMSTTINLVSSFDESFTSQDEPLVFSPVEGSPLDLCDETFDDLNHTPSQESVTLCNNKTSDGQTINLSFTKNECVGINRKLEHHPSHQYKRKHSSPCLGMKKLLSLSLPPKFSQEFEQDGGYRYNA